MMAVPVNLPNQRLDRRATVLALVFLSLLNWACSDDETQPQPSQSLPETTVVDSPRPPNKTLQAQDEISIVRPERDAARSLQAAKNLVLGVHVPTGFVMRTKRSGAVLGMVYTYEKNLTSFYRDLGYHVVKYERGYKITATARMVDALPPEKRELVRSAAIYTTPKRARWWSLQVLSSFHPKQKGADPDPMAFVNRVGDAPPKETAKVQPANTVTPRIPYIKRSFKRPKNTVDLRPKLREWIRTNPNRKFLD